MDFLSLVTGRRSVRRYQARAIDRELLQRVLSAVSWAPSPHNAEPWRFAVVRRNQARRDLADTMGKKWRADLAGDGLTPVEVDAQVGKSYERLLASPVVVVGCITMRDLDVYPDRRRQEAERIMATQALSASIQNLLLAAHEAGLATSWMCAPLFCPDLVREALDLPADWEPQAMITVGYAAQVKPAPARRPLQEVVLFR